MGNMKLKRRKEMTVAYLEHVGGYETIQFDVLIGKLYAWAKANKVRPGFKPLTIYPDDPNTTPKEQLRSWVGIPISGKAPEGGEVRTMTLPESDIAVYSHVGPASEYGNSYRTLVGWIAEQGYGITGPPAEYYPKKPKVKGGQVIIYADIQFPIRKK